MRLERAENTGDKQEITTIDIGLQNPGKEEVKPEEREHTDGFRGITKAVEKETNTVRKAVTARATARATTATTASREALTPSSPATTLRSTTTPRGSTGATTTPRTLQPSSES